MIVVDTDVLIDFPGGTIPPLTECRSNWNVVS
jgi:hypothetical protein